MRFSKAYIGSWRALPLAETERLLSKLQTRLSALALAGFLTRPQADLQIGAR